ncbi:MAG: alpha/beta hydrolase [Deltaproteobacteria bacterium]|nr:alpha/beta hydrolase [Deltaproteobacteria bacterium]
MYFKTAEGVDLHYRSEGAGQPLLLIHGLGGSTLDWEFQRSFLSGRFHLILADLRGHGRSGRPTTGYTIPSFASDTAALLTSLSLPPTHVVGISLGGMVAFQLALDCPHLVSSLVIVNSLPGLPSGSLRQHWELGQRLLVTRLLGMGWMARVLAKRLFPKEGQKGLRELFERRWAANDPRVYTATLLGLKGWSVLERLSSLTAPTLVVAGERDFIPLAFKQAYAKRIREGRLAVIGDSGHATPVDQPAAFNTLLAEFLCC